MRKTVLAASTLMLACVGFACLPEPAAPESPDSLNYSENAKAAYEHAIKTFEEHDWEEATAEFKEIKRRWGQSRYGRMAELRIADIAFEQDKLGEAVGSYRGFIQAHRNDADVGYAHYRICRSLFLQINDTILLPPLEERDQQATLDAYNELKRFKKELPHSKWDDEINYMSMAVAGRLARHELYVARYYLREDNYVAAVGRIQNALRSYPDSGLEPEAMLVLGETYLKLKKVPEATEQFTRIVELYADSPFLVPARAYLDRLAVKDTGR